MRWMRRTRKFRAISCGRTLKTVRRQSRRREIRVAWRSERIRRSRPEVHVWWRLGQPEEELDRIGNLPGYVYQRNGRSSHRRHKESVFRTACDSELCSFAEHLKLGAQRQLRQKLRMLVDWAFSMWNLY